MVDAISISSVRRERLPEPLPRTGCRAQCSVLRGGYEFAGRPRIALHTDSRLERSLFLSKSAVEDYLAEYDAITDVHKRLTVDDTRFE